MAYLVAVAMNSQLLWILSNDAFDGQVAMEERCLDKVGHGMPSLVGTWQRARHGGRFFFFIVHRHACVIEIFNRYF